MFGRKWSLGHWYVCLKDNQLWLNSAGQEDGASWVMWEKYLKFKGIFHAKMKILASFIHARVIPNPHDLLSDVEHKSKKKKKKKSEYTFDWSKVTVKILHFTIFLFKIKADLYNHIKPSKLSVKTQLKPFFCDSLHKVKNILWKCYFHIFNIDWVR